MDRVWRAPELEVRHYRTLFYGYDTVYYRLAAQKSPSGGLRYQLSIDAHYGGDLRHYEAVKFADGSSRPLDRRQHDTERCQFFNSLVYACLFRDQVRLELSPAELEAAQGNGLRMTLSSAVQDYEAIELPANYIRGFLQAVQGAPLPAPNP